MNTFSHKQTQVVKALALFLMVIHHAIDWEGHSYYFGRFNLVPITISLTKVCVALFTFLSAYGLVKSFQKKNISDWKTGILYMRSHVLKVFVIFWLGFILSVALYVIFVGNLSSVYRKPFLYHMLLNFMGLSEFTNTPRLLFSWWYISAILVYYLVFPFLYLILKRLGRGNIVLFFLLPFAFLLKGSWNTIIIYLVIFVQSLALSLSGYFDIIYEKLDKSWKNRFVGLICFLALTLLFVFIRIRFVNKLTNYYLFDGFFAVLLSIPIGLVLSKGSLGNVLRRLGDISFEMYIVHGMFIRYIKSFTYSYENSVLVVLKVYFLTLVIALGMKGIQKMFRIDRGLQSLKQPKRANVFAMVILLIILSLLTSRLIANINARDLSVVEKEIEMGIDEYKFIAFDKSTFLQSMAGFRYRSSNSKAAYVVDRVIYAREKGETVITVNIPFGKSEKIKVKVVE